MRPCCSSSLQFNLSTIPQASTKKKEAKKKCDDDCTDIRLVIKYKSKGLL